MKMYKDREFLALARSKRTYKQLEKELGVGKSTIHRYAQKFGLTKGRPPLWTGKEIMKLERNYPTNPDIYDLFPSRSIHSLNRKAHKLGLHRHVKPRQYTINHDFFRRWTPESSYVLGWMFSDGTVSRNMRSFGFHLGLKDINILKQIRSTMQSTQPIKIYSSSVMLRFNDKLSCLALVNLGCTPGKSRRMHMPDVPKRYLNHFVRGYFDGDGSIHFNKPNVIKITFVSASNNFLMELRNNIKNVTGLTAGPITSPGHNLYTCLYCGERARKFCEWIYQGSGKLKLQRKWKRYTKHMKLRSNETGSNN